MFTMNTLFISLAMFPLASHCEEFIPTDAADTGNVTVNKAPSPPQECTSFLVVEGKEVKECCLDTGYCKASSCTTLGFKSSQRANCPGPTPCCGKAYCNFTVPTCVPNQGQDEHCFGTVVCNDFSTTCCPDVGAICLEDGNSQNFKICGEAIPSPSPSPASPSTSPECSCPPASAECQEAEDALEEAGLTLQVDILNCTNPQYIADFVNGYGRSEFGHSFGCYVSTCDIIICNEFVPPEAYSNLSTCPLPSPSPSPFPN